MKEEEVQEEEVLTMPEVGSSKKATFGSPMREECVVSV
jgi:hypothetical protein